MPKRKKSTQFVSRGGDKLNGVLADLALDVSGLVAADLGANVGGFTDCLLQHGVRRVYAVDTGYGVLDWKLRQDQRVVVMERTNALFVVLPEPVDVVVVDVAWTSLMRIAPVALSLLQATGYVLALLKPQYEAQDHERQKGVVLTEYVDLVVNRVIEGLAPEGVAVANCVLSKVPGSQGNREFFLLLTCK